MLRFPESETDDAFFDPEALEAEGKALPPEILRGVFAKLARMTLTLREIEDWLDSRPEPALSTAADGGSPGISPRVGVYPLTLDNLDDVMRREDRLR